jgi:hypothetical protein
VRVQSPVKADAFGELLDFGVCRLAEDARPRFFRHKNSGPTMSRILPNVDNIFSVNGLRRAVNDGRAADVQNNSPPIAVGFNN